MGLLLRYKKAGEFIAGDGMNEMRTWYDTKGNKGSSH